MKLFERLFSQEPESEVATLHPNFRLKEGDWYFNRTFNVFTDEGITGKIRFGFDDPRLLDGCQFQAKIGMNLDAAIPNKYIGFAYARRQDFESLKEWGQKFPYAELIEGLNGDGVSTSESKVTLLTEAKTEDLEG